MCGICGMVGVSDAGLLQRMNNLLIHRGPDGEGSYCDPSQNVGLAMRRLSIIDLEGGAQPIFNEDKSVAIVFNGEIYNYKELSADLEKRGHRFSTKSDTEAIVHAYEEYGRDAVERLEGMFAFALWDRRRRLLFCARDRLGIKPFYYCQKNGAFYFASEQKPLITALDGDVEVDRLSLIRHMLIGFYTGPYSMFKNIAQLPPACTMTVKDGATHIERYWTLPKDSLDVSHDIYAGAEGLRQNLSDAVRSHMVSDVPVGLTLSGGLDSSAIAVLMSEMHNGRTSDFHAYTVGYGHDTDEIPFARLAVKGRHLVTHEEISSAKEAVEELPSVIWRLEEPLSNITAVTAYLWARFISRDLKVTLIGEGADEILGGYFQYRLFTEGSGCLPSPVALRLFRYACLQPPLALIINLLGGGAEVAAEVRHVYHDEFVASFMGCGKGLKSAMRFDLEYELSNNQLLRIDRMTMAHSLEARVPYLCHKFVEEVWRYPDRWRIDGGVQKNILKKAFEKDLPPEIISRPKIGRKGSQAIFPILFNAGLRRAMEQILLDTRRAHPWIDHEKLKDLFAGKAGVYPVLGERIKDKLLYTVFLFAVWHRLFMENGYQVRNEAPLLSELAA